MRVKAAGVVGGALGAREVVGAIGEGWIVGGSGVGGGGTRGGCRFAIGILQVARARSLVLCWLWSRRMCHLSRLADVLLLLLDFVGTRSVVYVRWKRVVGMGMMVFHAELPALHQQQR